MAKLDELKSLMKGCFFSEMLEFSLTMLEPNYVREVGWDMPCHP